MEHNTDTELSKKGLHHMYNELESLAAFIRHLSERVYKLEGQKEQKEQLPHLSFPTDENGFRCLTKELYPKWNDVTQTLIALDKRKNTDFSSHEIDLIRHSDYVLLYNVEENKYFVLKNRNGSHDFEFPGKILKDFLRDPSGKIGYHWRYSDGYSKPHIETLSETFLKTRPFNKNKGER